VVGLVSRRRFGVGNLTGDKTRQGKSAGEKNNAKQRFHRTKSRTCHARWLLTNCSDFVATVCLPGRSFGRKRMTVALASEYLGHDHPSPRLRLGKRRVSLQPSYCLPALTSASFWSARLTSDARALPN